MTWASRPNSPASSTPAGHPSGQPPGLGEIQRRGEVELGEDGQGDYTITSETCENKMLASGAACQVVLVFRPEALGARLATLAFTDTAANSPQTVPLTGTGLGK